MSGAEIEQDLEAAAHEEMERACDLGWARLAEVTREVDMRIRILHTRLKDLETQRR